MDNYLCITCSVVDSERHLAVVEVVVLVGQAERGKQCKPKQVDSFFSAKTSYRQSLNPHTQCLPLLLVHGKSLLVLCCCFVVNTFGYCTVGLFSVGKVDFKISSDETECGLSKGSTRHWLRDSKAKEDRSLQVKDCD